MPLLPPKTGSARPIIPWGEVVSTTLADTSLTGLAAFTDLDEGVHVALRDYIDWFYQVTEWNISGTVEFSFQNATATLEFEGGGMPDSSITLAVSDSRDTRFGLDGVTREIQQYGANAAVGHPTTAQGYLISDTVPYQDSGTTYGIYVDFRITVGVITPKMVQKYLDSWGDERFLCPIEVFVGYTIERAPDDISPGGPYDRNIYGTASLSADTSASPSDYRVPGISALQFTGLSGTNYDRDLAQFIDGSFYDFDMDDDGEDETSIGDTSLGLSAWFTVQPSGIVAAP